MAWPVGGPHLRSPSRSRTLAMIMMTTVTQGPTRTALTLTIAVTVTPSMTRDEKAAPGALEMKVTLHVNKDSFSRRSRGRRQVHHHHIHHKHHGEPFTPENTGGPHRRSHLQGHRGDDSKTPQQQSNSRNRITPSPMRRGGPQDELHTGIPLLRALSRWVICLLWSPLDKL